MKLYGNYTSPYVRHCRIALLESGLPCELSEADAAIVGDLSPLKKMPFFEYQAGNESKTLSDSSSILRYIREQSGRSFMPDVEDYNAYLAANTLLDTGINLFYMERDKITPEQSAYLQRQKARLQTGLADLEKRTYPKQGPWSDTDLRIACLLDWGLFRQRFNLEAYPKLQAFLTAIRSYPPFAETPPKA